MDNGASNDLNNLLGENSITPQPSPTPSPHPQDLIIGVDDNTIPQPIINQPPLQVTNYAPTLNTPVNPPSIPAPINNVQSFQQAQNLQPVPQQIPNPPQPAPINTPVHHKLQIQRTHPIPQLTPTPQQYTQPLNNNIQVYAPIPEKKSNFKKYTIITLIVLLVLCIVCSSLLYVIGAVAIKTNKALPSSPSSQLDGKRAFNKSTLSYYTSSELTKLGVVKLPQGFSVQEEYKGIKLVKSPQKSFTDVQLYFIKQFIDKTPKKLLSPGPSAIVTFALGEVDTGSTNPSTDLLAQAFSSGSYMFFNDNSFNPGARSDTTIDTVFRVFEHELVHIVQFDKIIDGLTESKLDQNYRNKKIWTDVYLNTALNKEFASIAGWQMEQDPLNKDYVKYNLVSKATEKTTDYGKTEIYEDMADTISSVITTKSFVLSDARKTWALKFLEENVNDLKVDKFPFNEEMGQVDPTGVKIDYVKEDSYKSNLSYQLTQMEGFLDHRANSQEDVKNFYTTELLSRGWTGSLKKTADIDNVIVYKGEFIGKNRDVYFEITSYDKAKNYTKKPVGTLIILINGFK